MVDSVKGNGWGYDNLNRMTSSPGFTYTNDVLGNRTSKIPSVGEATSYNWDDVNRLVGTGTYLPYSTAYKYRADGKRVSKLKVTGNVSTQTQATFYDGQMPVETVDFGTTDTVTRNFVGARGIEAIFTTTPTSDTTSYPLYDAHGNMTSTLSKAGNSYMNGNVRTYDAWGGIRTGAQTAGPNNRYCASLGHVQDDESGLIYMRARYYEPGTGRFISEDLSRRGENYFGYASQCPTDRSDASGNVDAWNGLLMSLAFLCSFVGVLLAFSGDLPAAILCARLAILLFTLEFMGDGLLGHSKLTLGQKLGMGGEKILMGGLSLGSTIQIPEWMGGWLQVATRDLEAGSRSRAQMAVMAVFAYSLAVCGALIAADAATD